MTTNILCVKWGDKYSSAYVNKLYNMVSRYYPTEFTFYCYTDDPKGIDPRVNIIPIKSDLTHWWLKIDLFKMFAKGQSILFDLDLVILKQLDILESLKTSRLSVLYSRWKEGFLRPRSHERFPTLYNSSVCKWTDSQGEVIYDYFKKHEDAILFKYQGIDRFLFNEDVIVDILPSSIAYSYWKGAVYQKDQVPEKYRQDYEICIINHNPKPHEIDSWIQDFWT